MYKKQSLIDEEYRTIIARRVLDDDLDLHDIANLLHDYLHYYDDRTDLVDCDKLSIKNIRQSIKGF